MIIECSNCNKEINKKPSYIKRYKNIYCSKECRTISKEKESLECKCGECLKIFYLKPGQKRKAESSSKNGLIFCSKSCSATYTNKLKGHEGIHTYRFRALEFYGSKCNRCGYDKYEEVLQVHHIDRNRDNGKLDNLEVLCPTCHNEEHFLNKDGSFWKQNNVDIA